MATVQVPEMNYTCEICGLEGFNDEEMRSHMVLYHLQGAANCPFCDLGEISSTEMLIHVNSAHLDYLTPRHVSITYNCTNFNDVFHQRLQLFNFICIAYKNHHKVVLPDGKRRARALYAIRSHVFTHVLTCSNLYWASMFKFAVNIRIKIIQRNAPTRLMTY